METSLGTRLRTFREHLDISQKEFSSRIGIGQPQLSAIEKDASKGSVDMIEALIKEFRYNPLYHFIGKGKMFIDENDIGDISFSSIQESQAQYQSQKKSSNIDLDTKKILEENWLLKRQVEQLQAEKSSLNQLLISAQEKIIKLLEKTVSA